MAEAHAPKHPYHLVNPSPWPLVGAISAFVLAIGAISYMHGASRSGWIVPGMLGVLYTMLVWWRDVIKEGQRGRPHAGRPARPALRHDPVHRLGGDVLRRLVLGLLRLRLLGRRAAIADRQGRVHRRSLAAEGHRGLRPLAPAAAQHADPADLGHHGHLGAPCAAPRRPQGPDLGPGPAPSCSASSSPPCRPTNTPTRRSPSAATSTAPPSSWRPASTASTSSSARSS